MTEELRTQFESLVGQQLSLQLDESGSIELELTACDATSSSQVSGFSLTFLTGADAPAVTQGTYFVSATGLEPMPIFLVPVGRRNSSLELQAIFAEPSAD